MISRCIQQKFEILVKIVITSQYTKLLNIFYISRYYCSLMAYEPLLTEFYRTRIISVRIEKLIIYIIYLIIKYDSLVSIIT